MEDHDTSTDQPFKPPKHFQEVYASYTSQNYKKTLKVLNQIDENHIEYSILKAACLIHLEKDLQLAHEILDDILLKHPQNAYTIYAKGLAHYHEENWEEAAELFDRARQQDQSPDMDRAEIMKQKALQKIEEENQNLANFEDEEPKPDSEAHSNDTSNSGDKSRRYGCEICDHAFAKKFNLDRHNRTVHRRKTPKDCLYKGTAVGDGTEPVKHENEEDLAVNVSYLHSRRQIAIKRKKRTNINQFMGKILIGKNLVRCNFCKKAFKRGSLARHMIIHTGQKSHKCGTCQRAFYQRSDLIRHETIHTDIFAFECELCQKKFRLKKNLQVHKRRHHFGHE